MSDPPSECLPVGSQFGVYKLSECIGRGAMGQVYRAEHTLLQKTVALKIMASAARNSSTGHHRFVREARAAAAVKHPNVVNILDMGVLEGLPFIVMEFLEGEDLDTYLRRQGTLSDRQIADLALPIIAALGAVHDAGVVHRDIKPSNIFLAKGSEEDVVPKVLDFGISKVALREGGVDFINTRPEDLVGTPLYISPEGLRGSQHLTFKSDQYSLGVMLYQCAAGRRPHEGRDLGRLVQSILKDPVVPLRQLKPGVSEALESAILRALSRRPEDRFDHVRELGAALWSLASRRTRHVWAKRFADASESSNSLSAPLTVRLQPRTSQRVWAAASACALLISLGLWTSVSWLRGRTRGREPIAASTSTAQLALTSSVPQRPAPAVSSPAASPPPLPLPLPSAPAAAPVISRAAEASALLSPAALAPPAAASNPLRPSERQTAGAPARRATPARSAPRERPSPLRTPASATQALPRASSSAETSNPPSEPNHPSHGANESPILD